MVKVNTLASKLIVASVAVAMLFTVSTPAQAQTVEELQAQINALMAQVAALTGGSASASAACTFTGSLTLGAQGAQVTCLQNYLINSGYSIPAGATGYFGAQTQAAVAAWQAAHGVTPAVGYFGPVSQAKFAAIAGTGTTGTGTETGSTSDLEGGAGSIQDADFISSLNNEQVGEDEEDVEVAGLEIEADGSDLLITSVGLTFDENTGATSDFEDYATEVSIWFDGEEVGRVDADEFNDDNDWNSNISLDEDAIIREGEVGELVVAISAVSNLDSSDVTDDWDVAFESVRFKDAQGAVVTDTSTGDIENTVPAGTVSRTFSFESYATASDAELKISGGDDSINDARTIEIEDTTDTDDVELLSFMLSAEGDSDLEIKKFGVNVDVTGESNVDDVIVGDTNPAIYMLIDGESYGDADYFDDADDTDVGTDEDVLFDDVDYVLEAGDEVEVTIVADLLSVTTGGLAEGSTIAVNVGETETDQTTLVDIDDESGTQLADADMTGSETGDAHVVYKAGFTFDLVSTSASVTTTGDAAASPATSDIGTFTIKFDLTAFGGDVWIEKSTCEEDGDQAGAGEGVSYGNSGSANNTVSCSVSSTASTDTSSWLVEDGQTESFTLTVAATATADHFAKMYLESINWSSSASASPASFFTAGLGEDNTSTDELFLNDN